MKINEIMTVFEEAVKGFKAFRRKPNPKRQIYSEIYDVFYGGTKIGSVKQNKDSDPPMFPPRFEAWYEGPGGPKAQTGLKSVDDAVQVIIDEYKRNTDATKVLPKILTRISHQEIIDRFAVGESHTQQAGVDRIQSVALVRIQTVADKKAVVRRRREEELGHLGKSPGEEGDPGL